MNKYHLNAFLSGCVSISSTPNSSSTPILSTVIIVNTQVHNSYPLELWNYYQLEGSKTNNHAQLAAGGVVRQTRKKYVMKEKRLTKIAEKFENGDYTH